MMDDATTVYEQINAAWREADLIDRRVMDTPGRQDAVAAVAEYYRERGRVGPPMGPAAGDTWIRWLHVLSHSLEEGHGLTHARCELLLTELVITALRDATAS